MALMSSLPASQEDLRLAIQDAVRSVAEDFRRRSPRPMPFAAAEPETQVAVAEPETQFEGPDPLEGQTILMVDDEEAAAAQPVDASFEEDRRSVEEALGIAAPAAPPSAAVAEEADAPPPSIPSASPLVEVTEPTMGARLLIFSWTALIRVLSILDLAVPAPLRRHKPLLGRIGMALTSLSAAFLVGMVLTKLLKGEP